MSLPCLFFLRPLSLKRPSKSLRGSTRCQNLGVMANKLVSSEFLSFSLWLEGLLEPLPLSLARPFKRCNFSWFLILYFSFLVFSKVYLSRSTCISPPLTHHPCSHGLPWTCVPAIFVFPNVHVCQPCKPDAFLLYYLLVTQPILGSQWMPNIYMSPWLLIFFSSCAPFYS